mmetsp:Transcript_25450/g.61556  ORF Transcript_25450/g.61556 Transcript_25450/m.61556 type:complete len:201 (+) Transcript_25450:685-1287(+)
MSRRIRFIPACKWTHRCLSVPVVIRYNVVTARCKSNTPSPLISKTSRRSCTEVAGGQPNSSRSSVNPCGMLLQVSCSSSTVVGQPGGKSNSHNCSICCSCSCACSCCKLSSMARPESMTLSTMTPIKTFRTPNVSKAMYKITNMISPGCFSNMGRAISANSVSSTRLNKVNIARVIVPKNSYGLNLENISKSSTSSEYPG